jgi:hypothetical protein
LHQACEHARAICTVLSGAEDLLLREFNVKVFEAHCVARLGDERGPFLALSRQQPERNQMNRKESHFHAVVHCSPTLRVPSVGLGQRIVQILALGFLSICFQPLAHGEDMVLTFTVPLELKAAAGSVSVWLNALNSSSNQVTWTFPRQIESRIVSPQGAFDGTLELRSAESLLAYNKTTDELRVGFSLYR